MLILRRSEQICDVFFFFQAEDGIRDLVRSRGLGDVYKRQVNKLFVEKLDSEGMLWLKDGSKLIISRRRKEEVLSLIHI